MCIRDRLQQREQSLVFSATIKGTEKQGSLPSSAEFMPRPLCEKTRTAKYGDFDKFVCKVRDARLHSDKPKQSPHTPYIRSRIVWNTQYKSDEERALNTQSEVQNIRITPHIRVLRRNVNLYNDARENDPSDDEQSTVVKRRTPARIIWNSRFHSAKHRVPILYKDADNDSALTSSRLHTLTPLFEELTLRSKLAE